MDYHCWKAEAALIDAFYNVSQASGPDEDGFIDEHQVESYIDAGVLVWEMNHHLEQAQLIGQKVNGGERIKAHALLQYAFRDRHAEVDDGGEA